MNQQMNYNDQEIKFNNWWMLIAIIIAFVLGVITGNTCACGQSPAAMRGYIGNQYSEMRVMVNCSFSEDNRELDFCVNENTFRFNVLDEEMNIVNDSVIWVKYFLDKNSIIIMEPAYEADVYIGDYCKLIIKDANLYDKLVFLFWLEPAYEEDIAKYQ